MFSDELITLRAPEPNDVDCMYIMENDMEAWSDGVTFAPVSRKQLTEYVANYDGDIYASCQLRLVVELNADRKVVGVIDLYDYDRVNRRAYVGIFISKAFRGQHIASHALALLCGYCRSRLDMKQLAAVVRDGNVPSCRLFVRAGFVVTGSFPQWVRHGNDYVDATHYQLILR